MKVWYIILSILFFSSCGGDEQTSVNQTKNDTTKNVEPDEKFNPTSGMEEGINTVKYPSGEIRMQGEVVQGKRHGTWTTWYKNGMKWSENTYNLGVLEGKTVTYYENGQVHYIGYYTNNHKSGQWIFFNEKGEQLKEEKY